MIQSTCRPLRSEFRRLSAYRTLGKTHRQPYVMPTPRRSGSTSARRRADEQTTSARCRSDVNYCRCGGRRTDVGLMSVCLLGNSFELIRIWTTETWAHKPDDFTTDKNRSIWIKCMGQSWLPTAMSSTYDDVKSRIRRNTVWIARTKVLPEFRIPNGVRVHSHRPEGVTMAVSQRSDGFTGSCQ